MPYSITYELKILITWVLDTSEFDFPRFKYLPVDRWIVIIIISIKSENF